MRSSHLSALRPRRPVAGGKKCAYQLFSTRCVPAQRRDPAGSRASFALRAAKPATNSRLPASSRVEDLAHPTSEGVRGEGLLDHRDAVAADAVLGDGIVGVAGREEVL